MRFGRGIIAVGSSPETRSLPRKPDPFWISMKASGKDSPSGTPIACCQRTKRPAFRHGGGNIRLYLRHRTGAMRVEHEYQRRGAVAYLAAWDVRRAKIFGRCEHTTGIAPFERLVSQVMAQEPYRGAPRVFWIMDKRLLASRTKQSPPADGQMAQHHSPAHTGPCQLVEPSGNLFLCHSEESALPQ